jgi:hypothetical protein
VDKQIVLFLNCADASLPTLDKSASLFKRAGKTGMNRHLPVNAQAVQQFIGNYDIKC